MNPGRQRGRAIEFPSADDNQQIDWEAFEQHLKKNHKVKVSRDLIRYSKPYAHLLQNMGLSELKDIRDTLRPNILKALSALAKYLGRHQEYQKAIRNYGFKWGGKTADQIIIDRLNKVEHPGEVFEWIRKAKAVRPQLTDFLDLIGITGLRLIEAVECYNLIIDLARQDKLGSYYNQKTHTLEHFRFKEQFIRKSKKAFISFVPEDLVKQISESPKISSADAVSKTIRMQGLKGRFGDIRESHGTFLTKYLREPEFDFLHGRVTSNVFMRNYFNPALIGDLEQRTFAAVQEILQKIS